MTTADSTRVPLELFRFSAALDAYPAPFRGCPLYLLMVDDAEPIGSPREYLRAMDGIVLTEERREYVPGLNMDWPFPAHEVPGRPDPVMLSGYLFERFELAKRVLHTQRGIAAYLEAEARRLRPDVVLLCIADGLSYYDLPESVGACPCLVEGATITEHGYRAAVGSPPLSRRLFAMGYANQAGFTYYSTEEGSLSGDVFFPFSESQVTRVRAFDEILTGLSRAPLARSFVLVALPGLDHLSHAHRDRPPRQYYRDLLLSRFGQLEEAITARGRTALTCLTADHGILWRDDLDGRETVVGDLYREDAYSPRYLKGLVARSYARAVALDGVRHTLLSFPYLTRKLRVNEWGVHGGLSAWESLVPLLIHAR